MRPNRRLFAAALVGAGLSGGPASADPDVEAVGHTRPRAPGSGTPRTYVVPAPCAPYMPCPPGSVVPGSPNPMNPNPMNPNPMNPNPMNPNPMNPNPMNPDPAQNSADDRGTSASRSALPGVFGDLPGGGGIGGPLPVRVLNGQFIGPAPVVVAPNGQRFTLNNPSGQRTASDELILQRPATLPASTPGGQTIGLLPPPGTVFAPELAGFVARVPQVVYGPFKVTENETPRPTTRVYTSYYFYDNLFKGFGGPDTPRITLHQEVFGFEKAFADGSWSLGVRLPYNQLVGPPGFNYTFLGNLTVVSKFVLAEDRSSGSLLSGGVVVTAPTGNVPFASTTDGQSINSTLIQPYLGYILNGENMFLQGFSSVIVPTDESDTTFLSNDMALGYKLREVRGNVLSGIYPVFEAHLTNPLNNRGSQHDPVGFVDTLTLLGGTHFTFYDRSALGIAVGAPVTGPRPFSLQATVQLNVRF